MINVSVFKSNIQMISKSLEIIFSKNVAYFESILNCLHELKLIAGDLKPGNVLCTTWKTENNGFLNCHISLNVSSCAASVVSATGPLNDMMYTILYSASEFLTPEFTVNVKPIGATDIFEFAITIYEIMFPENDINIFITPPIFGSPEKGLAASNSIE